MTDRWTKTTVARLTDFTICPRCGARPLVVGVCSSCLADLRGPVAIELGAATTAVVEALEARAEIIGRLPDAEQQATPVSPAVVAPSGQAPQPAVPLAAVPLAARPSSQLSLQSVLAVAGAGLFAIAAIFFTFLNPDLEGQHDLRTLIVAVTTVVFLGGAWLLSRAGLTFSGETVGALGMVFVALDVWSVSRYAQQPVAEWTAAAIATFVASAVMIGIALLARIRTWLWTGVIALALVPAFFGYGADHEWYSIVGHVGTGFAAVAIVAVLPLLSRRFGGGLGAERVALVAIRVLLLPVIAVQLVATTPPAPLDQFLGAAAVLFALAVLSAVSTRDSLPRLWSFGAGGLAGSAAAVVALYWNEELDTWLIAVVPFAAVAALALLTGLLQLGPAHRDSVHRGSFHRLIVIAGAWIVAVLVSVPAGLLALVNTVTVDTWRGDEYDTAPAVVGVLVPFVAGALVTVLGPRLARTPSGATAVRTIALSSAAWFGMYALLSATSLSSLTVEARLALGIASVVVVAVVVWRVAAVASSPLNLRVPLVLGAHVILLHSLVQAWQQGVVGTIAQVAIVLAILLLSTTVVRPARPAHVVAAMTLALFVFSGALDEYTTLHPDVIVAMTATLGLLGAIVSTLIPRLRVEYWYAVLIVAAVPFVLALGWRLAEDTTWTALPAGVAALLGIVLTVSQRPGHLAPLRALAAAMVVPGLAVVAVGVVPAVADTSGSPIVLPIVAALVAMTLPFTVAIGQALEQRGIDAVDARMTRLAVEASALATAAIAVAIALLRVAAGFDTTFLVLAIVGLGGAATALFSARRYGWVITYVTWSGALWCLFALWGVDVLEPYVLPPAVAAVIIGGVAVFRGRPGQWMVLTGLVVGALPTLGLLAIERGDDAAVAWRLWGLVGSTVLLIGLGLLFARLTRLASLRVPVLAVAILTASAAAIAAVNRGIDRSNPLVDAVTFDIMPVLGLAVLAAVLAAVAARLIGSATNWLAVPALAYLLVGTAAGIRQDAVSIWTLFCLMIVYLIGMLVVVVRTRTRPSRLPAPVVWFAFAWVASVVSWSQREVLRVEGFSVPMAVALLAAGIVAWRTTDRAATITSWPVGFTGSWRLLGPGLFVLFVPSILATFTTPETWRAVFVIVLALAAILLGSRLKLAAPFIGGIAVLPLENIVVFSVQASRDIQSTPWWVTLASAGAVLLAIAVTSERKTHGGGIAARIRDLN